MIWTSRNWKLPKGYTELGHTLSKMEVERPFSRTVGSLKYQEVLRNLLACQHSILVDSVKHTNNIFSPSGLLWFKTVLNTYLTDITFHWRLPMEGYVCQIGSQHISYKSSGEICTNRTPTYIQLQKTEWKSIFQSIKQYFDMNVFKI